jgi:hypothetical protein
VRGPGAVERAHVPAVAQHADAVAQLEQLRHAVGHVDDRGAGPLELPDQIEQPPHVGLGERTCRLVEHDRPGVGRDGRRDLYELFLGGGEPAHRRVRVDARHADPAQHGPRAAAHRTTVDEHAEPPRIEPHAEVLAHREVGAKCELLVHHRYAEPQRIPRGADANDLVVKPQPAVVGPVDAGEDLPERAFARPVLSDQPVRLA